MARAKTFFIALVTALVVTSGIGAQGVLAEDADAGAARPQGEMKDSEKGKEQGERSLEPGKGEDTSPKENGEGKTQESPQKKKPRLKYWDPFECGC
jgi:hypothetical protein